MPFRLERARIMPPTITSTCISIATFSLSLGVRGKERADGSTTGLLCYAKPPFRSRLRWRASTGNVRSAASRSDEALLECRRACSHPTSSAENAVHGRPEASPQGAPDESACGVKVARRRITMPSRAVRRCAWPSCLRQNGQATLPALLCLAGESVRSPE